MRYGQVGNKTISNEIISELTRAKASDLFHNNYTGLVVVIGGSITDKVKTPLDKVADKTKIPVSIC